MSVGKKRLKREIVRELEKQKWAKLPLVDSKPVERVIPPSSIEMFSKDKIQPLRALRAKQRDSKRVRGRDVQDE